MSGKDDVPSEAVERTASQRREGDGKETKKLWAKVAAATTTRRKSSVSGQNFMLNVRDLLKLNAAGKFSLLPPLEDTLAVLLAVNKRSGRAKLDLQSVKVDGKMVSSCFKGTAAGATANPARVAHAHTALYGAPDGNQQATQPRIRRQLFETAVRKAVGEAVGTADPRSVYHSTPGQRALLFDVLRPSASPLRLLLQSICSAARPTAGCARRRTMMPTSRLCAPVAGIVSPAQLDCFPLTAAVKAFGPVHALHCPIARPAVDVRLNRRIDVSTRLAASLLPFHA